MAKYIPPEKMTVAQILAEIEHEYIRWNHIANNSCQDPFWPDGCNMNLIRKHIIYWYSILANRQAAQSAQQEQLSLFTEDTKNVAIQIVRPLPPEVPPGYMVSGCKYSDRLNNRKPEGLVWGHKGEYKA